MSRKHRTAIAWLLVVVMTYSPALVHAQPSAASKPAIDLGYITPDTFAAIVAYPRYVLTAPEMELLPTELFTAAGKKELGSTRWKSSKFSPLPRWPRRRPGCPKRGSCCECRTPYPGKNSRSALAADGGRQIGRQDLS